MTITVHIPYSLLVVIVAWALLGITCLLTRKPNLAKTIDREAAQLRCALEPRQSAASRSTRPYPLGSR